MQISPTPRTPAPQPLQFKIEGGKDDGFYEAISAQDVRVELEHKPSYTNIGGLLIEGEGTYSAKGNVQGQTVKLDVVPEDQIADVGGLHVQTGTVYHVAGKVGQSDIKGDIREEHTVADAGGIHIETDRWKVFEGPSVHLEVHGDQISGQDHGHSVNGKIQGLTDPDEMLVSGEVPLQTLAELVSLRPFLAT